MRKSLSYSKQGVESAYYGKFFAQFQNFVLLFSRKYSLKEFLNYIIYKIGIHCKETKNNIKEILEKLETDLQDILQYFFYRKEILTRLK